MSCATHKGKVIFHFDRRCNISFFAYVMHNICQFGDCMTCYYLLNDIHVVLVIETLKSLHVYYMLLSKWKIILIIILLFCIWEKFMYMDFAPVIGVAFERKLQNYFCRNEYFLNYKLKWDLLITKVVKFIRFIISFYLIIWDNDVVKLSCLGLLRLLIIRHTWVTQRWTIAYK